MDLGRDELLGILRSMGVELPRKTKLPDAELEKRLSKALDSCQYLSRVVPSPPLNPNKYPAWNMSHSLLEAVRRHNFGEATVIHDSRMQGVDNPFPLYENAFMDLRQSMMSIGHNLDKSYKAMIFQDKDQKSGICMKVLEIREFDVKTPITIVVFRHDLRSAPSPESIAWISSYVHKTGGGGLMNVTATLQEQQLLLRLLKQNSKRLPPSYKPTRARTERAFTLSFLLPVGPLGAKEMGTYNRNDGCSVCGEPAKSKCSRCSAIRYCSPACQKEDWKTHKPLCTSLMGATWQTVPFSPAGQPVPGAQALWINRFTNVFHGELSDQIEKLKDGEVGVPQPPPNTHGSMPFIVKVQLNSHAAGGPGWPALKESTGRQVDPGLDGTSILIYDRQRTFEVTVNKKGEGDDGFERVAHVVRSKGYQGLKIFCWAIVSGEWDVDICLDHLPEWQKW